MNDSQEIRSARCGSCGQVISYHRALEQDIAHYENVATERITEGPGIQLACLTLIRHCQHAASGDYGGPSLEMVRLAKRLVDSRPVSPPPAPTIHELHLCEASRLILHPGELYRFTEDRDCAECKLLAACHHPHL